MCVYFFTYSVGIFSVSESLVGDERKVCGHSCSYSKYVETSRLPRRASRLRGRALSALFDSELANAAVTPDLLPAKGSSACL